MTTVTASGEQVTGGCAPMSCCNEEEDETREQSCYEGQWKQQHCATGEQRAPPRLGPRGSSKTVISPPGVETGDREEGRKMVSVRRNRWM